MVENKEIQIGSELKIKGLLINDGIRITKDQNQEFLSSKGYGVSENDIIVLKFYEALYLLDRKLLELEDSEGNDVDFTELLNFYRNTDQNGWAKYLSYRDLRSRGYVVRDGFGIGVDFRVYERGDYGKRTAKYLIVNLQEGQPLRAEYLTKIIVHCQSLKKNLLLAVMNRRGEIVYYSLSKLTFKKGVQ
jgi:tRNA-intron endonuclease